MPGGGSLLGGLWGSQLGAKLLRTPGFTENLVGAPTPKRMASDAYNQIYGKDPMDMARTPHNLPRGHSYLLAPVGSMGALGQHSAEYMSGLRTGLRSQYANPAVDFSQGLGSAWARAQIAGSTPAPAATKPAATRPAAKRPVSAGGGGGDWGGNDYDYDSPGYDPGGYNAPGTGAGIDDDFDDYGSYAGEGPSGDPGYGYDTGDDGGYDDGGYDDGGFDGDTGFDF